MIGDIECGQYLQTVDLERRSLVIVQSELMNFRTIIRNDCITRVFYTLATLLIFLGD